MRSRQSGVFFLSRISLATDNVFSDSCALELATRAFARRECNDFPIRALGFAPLSRAGLVITADKPSLDLGTLGLSVVATQLEKQTVTAERDEVVLAPDRNSYSTKNMTTASGGTSIDVLRNVPSVEVDGSNNVSLRGNANVVVQINGRASPLKGEQLGNFLAQLPASAVTRVEVATNPSAKHDPEGTAGGSIWRYSSDASNLSGNLSVRAVGWSARTNLTWKLSPLTDVQAFANYRAPMATEGGSQSAFVFMNLGLRHKLWGDAGNISLRVADPFNLMQWGDRTANGQVIETSERHFGQRGLFITVTRNFGQQLKLHPRPQDPEAQAAPPGPGVP